eukprot:TRINITY_DN11855_c0_g1_i2.p2 TRINITY_DN11855_c0_g1~~TRINITY_DN11855_c0_g1_i2.p2  ORF type:complete len:218 (-),score=17.92 TRINITY_DN11855_c0_g1_i2:12-665(-)
MILYKLKIFLSTLILSTIIITLFIHFKIIESSKVYAYNYKFNSYNNLIKMDSDKYDDKKCDVIKQDLDSFIKNIFMIKSKAILNGDLKSIGCLYDTNTRYGIWAYEYEERKVKYINNWAEKQGIKFIDITPQIVIGRSSKIKGDTAQYYVFCNTRYTYVYKNELNTHNTCNIGTYHIISLSKNDSCLLYTSDAADEEDSVKLGGSRIYKKKKKEINR